MWEWFVNIEKTIENLAAKAEQKGCELERSILNGKTVYEHQDELIKKVKDKING